MTIGRKAGHYCHFRVLRSINSDTGRKKGKRRSVLEIFGTDACSVFNLVYVYVLLWGDLYVSLWRWCENLCKVDKKER